MAYYRADLDDSPADDKSAAILLVWLTLHGMGGDINREEDIQSLRDRTTNPRQFLTDMCDEKFTDEDVSDEGAAFVDAYFFGKSYQSPFELDVVATFPQGLSTSTDAATVWSEYDRLAPAIQAAYRSWKARNPPIRPKPAPKEISMKWVFTILGLMSIAVMDFDRGKLEGWLAIPVGIFFLVYAILCWIGDFRASRKS